MAPTTDAGAPALMEAAPTRTRSRRPRPHTSIWRAVTRDWAWVSPAVILLVAACWEIGGAVGYLPQEFFSRPSDIARAGRDAFATGRLVSDIWSTFASLSLGVAIGLAYGLAVGVLFGRVRRVRWSFEWMFLIFNSLPRVTLAPLLLIFFGLGMSAKVWIAFLASAVPVTLLVSTATQEISRDLFLVSDAFCLNRLQRLRAIILPAVAPHCLTGLQLGTTRALLAVVVAEMFNPHVGLGRWIGVSLTNLDPAQLMFSALLVGFFGAFLVRGLVFVEKKVVPWR